MFNADLVYYSKPYQIIFLRPDLTVPIYEKGIVFKHHIIAASDGEVFTTRQVLRCAKQSGIDEDYAIVESFEWFPIEID